jgi:hypothetical protein
MNNKKKEIQENVWPLVTSLNDFGGKKERRSCTYYLGMPRVNLLSWLHFYEARSGDGGDGFNSFEKRQMSTIKRRVK